MIIQDDFIRTYLGRSRKGKTTRALEFLEANFDRKIVYAIQYTNTLMQKLYNGYVVKDTDINLELLNRIMEIKKRILILRTISDNSIFEILKQVRNCGILADDIPSLLDNKKELVSFIGTVGMNGNYLIMTAHMARNDMPPKALTLSTSIIIVGGWNRSKIQLKFLYENIGDGDGLSFDEYYNKLVNGMWGEEFYILE